MMPMPQEMMPNPYGQLITPGERTLMLKKQKKHKHRHKKIKDPNAPKRARTAFMQFSVRMRDHAKELLKAEGQEPTPKLVAKKLGELWRGLNDEQKKPYIEEAEKDKKRYMMEKSQYTPTITQATTLAYPSSTVIVRAPQQGQQQGQQHVVIPQGLAQQGQQHVVIPQGLTQQQQHALAQQQVAMSQAQGALGHRRRHPGKHSHHHSHHHHAHQQGPPQQVPPQGMVGLPPPPGSHVLGPDPSGMGGVMMNGSESESSSESDSGVSRRTHKRKKKDPNAPKRNKSPYIIFTEVFRDNVV